MATHHLFDFGFTLGMQEVRVLSVAVPLESQAGGNRAEILDGLAKVIRSRFRLFRRVRAITAEAKWSGVFLSAFPLVVLAVIQLLKPDYFDTVKDTPAFVPAALIAFVFLGINVIFMKMMVNIKV